MTNEEAIKELKEDRALYESDIVEAGDGTPDGDLMLAIDMAIEALEKQIPKKKKKRNECPECGYSYAFEEFCPYCGQALDWSDYKCQIMK